MKPFSLRLSFVPSRFAAAILCWGALVASGEAAAQGFHYRQLTFDSLPPAEDLVALGIEPVMLTEFGSSIVARVPQGFDGVDVPGLLGVATQSATDKLQEGHEGFLDPGSTSQTLIVQAHLGVAGQQLSAGCLALGATDVHVQGGLADNLRVVTAPGSVFLNLLNQEEIAQLVPLPADYHPDRAFHVCLGMRTSYGPAQFGVLTDGWDGPGRGCATLTYHFESDYDDLPVAGQREALRSAMEQWSQVADLHFLPTNNKNEPHSIDFQFTDLFPSLGGHGVAYALPGAGYPDEPDAGDVSFDNQLGFALSLGLGSTDYHLESIAMHYLGHALGVNHVTGNDSVMSATVDSGKEYAAITLDDAALMQEIYSYGGYGYESQVLGSGLANAVDGFTLSQVDSRVYYNGPAGKLWSVRQAGSVWVEELLGPIGNVTADMAANSFDEKVFYRATDGRLWNLYEDASGWHQAPLDSAAPANVAGDVMKSSTGNQVFYRGTDGRMWNFYYSGGDWHYDTLDLGVNDVAGDVAVTPLGTNVYYRNTSDQLSNFYWSSSLNDWLHGELAPSLTNVSGGTCTSPISSHVFSRGHSGLMWGYRYSGGWIPQILSTSATDTTTDMATSDVFNKVFYRTGDHRVRQLFESSTAPIWRSEFLASHLHDVAGPIAVRNGDVYYRGTDNRIRRLEFRPCPSGVE